MSHTHANTESLLQSPEASPATCDIPSRHTGGSRRVGVEITGIQKVRISKNKKKMSLASGTEQGKQTFLAEGTVVSRVWGKSPDD